MSEKLLAACVEFVRKVECDEAQSVRSYTQMKEAIAEYEQSSEGVVVEIAFPKHTAAYCFRDPDSGAIIEIADGFYRIKRVFGRCPVPEDTEE